MLAIRHVLSSFRRLTLGSSNGSHSLWKQLIKKHFDRGLKDGKFPKKVLHLLERKEKDIVLDEKEIQRQSTIVMNDLSALGCWTVLHGCLKEEYNVEVMNKARCVSNKLIHTFTCHKFYRVPENDEVEGNEPYVELMDVPLDLTITSSYKEPMVGVPLENHKWVVPIIPTLVMRVGDRSSVELFCRGRCCPPLGVFPLVASYDTHGKNWGAFICRHLMA